MPRRAIPPHIRDAWQSQSIARLRQELAAAAAAPLGAIVFDAYGTLFDLRAIEVACADLTPDAAAFAALWRANTFEYSWQRTLLARYPDLAAVTAEALDHALARFALRPEAAARKRLLAAWTRLDPFPDVAGALAALAPHPRAILSNGTPAMLAAALRHAKLTKHFAAVLSVDAAKAYKPDPRAYDLAAAALDLPATPILFVTANAWDAIGAKTFGYRVAWCNRAAATFDTHGPAPDAEIGSLAELAGLVG